MPAKIPKRRRLRFRATQRRPSRAYQEKMEGLASELLETCEHLWGQVRGLDTAVGDTGAQGLAYLLWVAFDCQALSQNLSIDDWQTYSETQIFKWFHDRGFAVWFCLGASNLFHKSRPRICGGFIPMPRKKSHAKKEN